MIIIPFIAGLLWGALSCTLVIFFSLFTIRTRLDQLVRKKTLKHVEFKAVAEEAANLPPVKVETLCKVVQFDDDIVGDAVQCRVVLFSNTVYVYRVDKLITLPDHREEVVEEHLLGKINASCVVATGERISKYHRHRNKTKRYAAVKGKCTILAARPNLPLFMEDPAEKLRRYIAQSKREQLERQNIRARRLLSLSLPSETSYTITSRVGSQGCVEELPHPESHPYLPPSLLIANNTPSRTNSRHHDDEESTHKVKSNGIDYSNGLNRSFRSTPRQREDSSQSVLVKATSNNNNNNVSSKINSSGNKVENTPQNETNCNSNTTNVASPNPASITPLHSSEPSDIKNNIKNNYLHKECLGDSSTLSKRLGRTKHKRYGERSSDSASNEGSSSSEEFTCRNDAALSETPIAQWRRMAIKFPTRRVQERWLNLLQGTAQTVQWSDYLHHLPQLDVFNLITARLFYENTRTNGLNDLLTRKFQEKLTRTSKSLPSTLKGTISLESLAIGGEVPLFTHVSEGVVSPLGELDFEFDVLYRGGLKLSIRFAIAYRGIRLPDIIFHITVLELAGRVFFNVGPPPTHKFWLSVPRAPQLRMSFTQEIASREGILNAIVSGIPDLSKVMTNVVKDLLFEDMICPKWDDFPWPVVERTKTDTIKVERRGAAVYSAEEKEKPCTTQGKQDHLVCDSNKHIYHHKVPCSSTTVKGGNGKVERHRYTSPGTYEMNRSYSSQESLSRHSSGYVEPIHYNVPCGSPNYNYNYNSRPYSSTTSSPPSLTSSYYISSSSESLSSWSNSSLSSSLSSSSSSETSSSYSSSADSASHLHNVERRSNKVDHLTTSSSSSYSSPVTPLPTTTTTTTTTTRTGVVNTTDGPMKVIDTTITTNATNDSIHGDKRKVLSHKATSPSKKNKKKQNKEDESGVIVTSSPAEVLREHALINKDSSSSSLLESRNSDGHPIKHAHREHVEANGSAIHVIDDQHLDTNTKHIINRKVAVRHAAIDDEEERDARKYELKMRDSNLDSSELSELVDSQNSVDDDENHRENSPHEKHLRENNNYPHTHHAIPTPINDDLNSTITDHHTRHLERDYAKASIQPQITSYGEEHRMQHGNEDDSLHNTHTSTKIKHHNNNNVNGAGNSATRLNDELNESNSSNRNTMVINFLNGRDEHNNHTNSGPMTAHEEKEFKRHSNKRHHHHDGGGKSNKNLKEDDDDDELIHPAQGVTVRKGGAMDPNAPSKREKKMMEREKKYEEEHEEEREYELEQAQEREGEFHHHHLHHNNHYNNDDVHSENNYNNNNSNSYCSTNDIYGDGDVNVVDMVPFSHTHPRKSSVGNKIKHFVSELEHSVERSHSFHSSGRGSVSSNRNSMSLFSAQSNVNNCSGTSTVSSKKGKKRGFFAKRISEFGSFIQNKKHKPVLNASSSNVF